VDVQQIPDLISASVNAASNIDSTEFKSHKVPRGFEAIFEIKDKKVGHFWKCVFFIGFGVKGTPALRSVSIYGSLDGNDPIIKEYVERNRKINDINPVGIMYLLHSADSGDPESQGFPEPKTVERWQIKYVEMYRFQLLELAVQLAITRLEHFEFSNVDSYFDWWGEKKYVFSAAELKKIQKDIQMSIRQKISPEFLKEVAALYISAAKNGEKPVKAIQERYKCSYRTASDYGTKAREAGFLPPTTPGKVVISSSPKTKKGR
jgi:hypothetical protein